METVRTTLIKQPIGYAEKRASSDALLPPLRAYVAVSAK